MQFGVACPMGSEKVVHIGLGPVWIDMCQAS